MILDTPATTTAVRRIGRVTRVLLLRALPSLLVCMIAPAASAASPVWCDYVLDTGFRSYIALNEKPLFRQKTSVGSAEGMWLSPGLQVVHDSTTNRILCWHQKGTSSGQQLYFKVTPTQAYLDALQAHGLDARVAIRWAGGAEELMLRRDAVPPDTGRAVELKGLQSLPWSHKGLYAIPEPRSMEEVPNFTVDMQFLYVDPGKRSAGSRMHFEIPDSWDIMVEILALSNTLDTLKYRGVRGPRTFGVGVCPAPTVTINDSAAHQVDIDFGAVALDMLMQYGGNFAPKEFSVEFKPPAAIDASCKSSAANKGPRVRFVAAGRFRNGMFEGNPNDTAYPGNSSVAIQLRDQNGPVVGANPGDIDPRAFVPVTGSDRRRHFTATVKEKPGGARGFGPFLIPVTVEAFYN
jgi:hypothetical protein